MKKLVFGVFAVIALINFSCTNESIEAESVAPQEFTQSVAIVSMPKLIATSSRVAEDSIPKAVSLELYNFSKGYELKPVYKINDIEYCDNGLFNDAVAGDGVYTSVETFTKENSPVQENALKIATSQDFQYTSELKEKLADNSLPDSSAVNGFSVSITCNIKVRKCPNTTWYNTCWTDSPCSCVYLEDCQVSVGYSPSFGGN